MELFETINNRHSYRGEFTSAAIDRDTLKKIVAAGVAAPSGCNKQTTEFIAVDDAELAGKIASLSGANPVVKTAKAFILCVIDKDPKPVYEEFSFQVEDCAAAVENMLLAITALGLASVWIDGWLRREGRAEQIAKWVDLDDDKMVRILLPIGKPAEWFNLPEKLKFEDRVCFNRYR